MPNFIYTLTGSYGSLTPATSYPKLDDQPLTGSPYTHVSSSEYNAVVEGLVQTSYAITSGTLFGFVRSASSPTGTLGNDKDYIWLDSNGNLMQHLRTGVDRFLSGNVTGGGGGFYQTVQSPSGTSLTQRTILGFDGYNVIASDDSATARTVVTVSGDLVFSGSNNQLIWNKILTGSWQTAGVVFTGSLLIRKDNLIVANTGSAPGLTLNNPVTAVSGTASISPGLVFSVEAFHSTASVSQNVKLSGHLVATQANPVTGTLVFYHSVNNSAPRVANINGHGLIGYTELDSLGATNTTSTSFGFIGDRATTGYASWTTPYIAVPKVYMIMFDIITYMSAGAAQGTLFQVMVDGVVTPTQPIMGNVFASTNSLMQYRGMVPCFLSGGLHTLDLQWRVTGGTANINAGGGFYRLHWAIMG